jgi:hypothetical protein
MIEFYMTFIVKACFMKAAKSNLGGARPGSGRPRKADKAQWEQVDGHAAR